MKQIEVIYHYKKNSTLKDTDLSDPRKALDEITAHYKKNQGYNMKTNDISMSDRVAMNTAKAMGKFRVISADKKEQGIFTQITFTVEF